MLPEQALTSGEHLMKLWRVLQRGVDGASLFFWEELTGEDPERASADIRHIYSLSEHIRAWEYRRAPRAPVLMLTAPIPCCLSRDPFWTPFIPCWYITACKSRTADIRLCSDLTIFIRHGEKKKSSIWTDPNDNPKISIIASQADVRLARFRPGVLRGGLGQCTLGGNINSSGCHTKVGRRGGQGSTGKMIPSVLDDRWVTPAC